MAADLGARIGGEWNATAAYGFRNYKRKALFYAGEDEEVAVPH
jgi:hypothetical protein